MRILPKSEKIRQNLDAVAAAKYFTYVTAMTYFSIGNTIDKEFLLEDTRSIKEIAPLFNILQKCLKDKDRLLEKVLFYRHFLYETDEPFMHQFKRNNRVLNDELERIINKYTDIYGG